VTIARPGVSDDDDPTVSSSTDHLDVGAASVVLRLRRSSGRVGLRAPSTIHRSRRSLGGGLSRRPRGPVRSRNHPVDLGLGDGEQRSQLALSQVGAQPRPREKVGAGTRVGDVLGTTPPVQVARPDPMGPGCSRERPLMAPSTKSSGRPRPAKVARRRGLALRHPTG
jgi:hypothetical protein